MFRVIVSIAVLFATCALIHAESKHPPDLLLISWKQPDGRWVFRVIPDNRWVKSTHDQILEFAYKTMQFEAGIPWPDAADTLQLYANTPQRIVWVHYVGTPLRYPPNNIVDGVKRYANTHKVH
jgi:hypothetical protein